MKTIIAAVIIAWLIAASSTIHAQVYVHWQDATTIYNGAGQATPRTTCYASNGTFEAKTYHYSGPSTEIEGLDIFRRDDGYVTEVILLLGPILADRLHLKEDLVLANPPGVPPAITNESRLLLGPENAFRTFSYRFAIDTEWIYPPSRGQFARRGRDTSETVTARVYSPSPMGRICCTPLTQTSRKTEVGLPLRTMLDVPSCCVPKADHIRLSFAAKRIASDELEPTGSPAMVRVSLEGLGAEIYHTYQACNPLPEE